MFEEALQRQLFQQTPEKTSIDKLLGRKDIEDIRKLMKKSKLTREDLLELLYMLSGSEIKLLNMGEYERYVLMKYFVWIREFIKVAELLFDYQDDLKKRGKNGAKITDITIKLLSNNERLIEHNAKFLIDLYFNIGRSSLSIGATGFMEFLKNRWEVDYKNDQQLRQITDRPGLFRRGGSQ